MKGTDLIRLTIVLFAILILDWYLLFESLDGIFNGGYRPPTKNPPSRTDATGGRRTLD